MSASTDVRQFAALLEKTNGGEHRGGEGKPPLPLRPPTVFINPANGGEVRRTGESLYPCGFAEGCFSANFGEQRRCGERNGPAGVSFRRTSAAMFADVRRGEASSRQNDFVTAASRRKD